MRTTFNEVTPGRLLQAISRRVVDQSVRLEWALGAEAKRNRERLLKLKDSFPGETAIVICNGPSLNATDMSIVKSYKSIAMNRSYLMYEEWGFTPTFFTSINHLVLDQFADDIRALNMMKFVDFTHRDAFPEENGFCYFRIPPSLSDAFQTDLTKPMASGGTVTYVSLQLAYYLGFTKVIIIGMDHRFSAVGIPNVAETRTEENDRDHVHPNYFPKGMKWQLPDLHRSELAYREARKAFERDGRRIIDATVGGACEVFPKMALADAVVA